MRLLLLLACLTASCAKPAPGPTLKPGTYFGQGRDALCVRGDAAPQSFAFIAFAPTGDSNCAAEGRIEHSDAGWALVPAGEGGCRIPVRSTGESVAFGAVPAACSYYCGPGAALHGQSFGWKDTSAMRLAEQPLAHGGVC